MLMAKISSRLNGLYLCSKRHYHFDPYFTYRPRPKKYLLRRYRKRFKALVGTLGLKGSPKLEGWYPKFNRSHLSEELKELLPVIPEDQKPTFTVKILIRGIGYRAYWLTESDEKGNEFLELRLRLGFTHEIDIKIPDGIEVLEGDIKQAIADGVYNWVGVPITVADCQEILLKGKNFQQVTQFAATIKRQRPPDPYKLKGVFVDTGRKRTYIRRKKPAGK